MLRLVYIFAICAVPLFAKMSKDGIAGALEEDAVCNKTDSACNLQLLQVKRDEAIIPGIKKKVPPLKCGFNISRYNFMDQQRAFMPTEVCDLGAAQSPIDIPTLRVQSGSAGPLDVVLPPEENSFVVNTGHNLQVDTTKGHIWVNGVKYNLAQYHVHMIGEHKVNAFPAAAELHFVFTYTNGMDKRIAVVGLFFDISFNPFYRGSKLIEQMIQNIPPESCAYPMGKTDIWKEFEKQFTGPYWSYNGSLTTPGCDENVRWQVLKKRARMSLRQFWRFKTQAYWFPANGRDIQGDNGRIIYLNNPKSIWPRPFKQRHSEETEESGWGPCWEDASEEELQFKRFVYGRT